MLYVGCKKKFHVIVQGLKQRIKLYKTRPTQKTMEGEGFATLVLKTKQLLHTAMYSQVPITSLSIIDMCAVAY